MITVITGTPGSGKTLFTIQKLLLPLIGQTIDVTDDDGHVEKMPRRIYTNINGLQIDHDRIDDSEDYGLKGWHNWALPGSVIVFDEFQKAWPPRPNGSKVPPDVQALDTHRHMGVDFILITQNSANVDRHVHGLVGRHLHIRRLANAPVATVYEWDHLSKSLMFSKTMKMSPFFFSRKVYKLYKSAKVHTKQPRSMPSLVWVLIAAVAGLAYLGPSFYGRMKERTSGPVASAAVEDKKVISKATITTQGPPPGMVLPDPEGSAPGAPAAPLPVIPSPTLVTPVIAGCVAVPGRCSCVTSQGEQIDQDESMCQRLQDTRREPATMGSLRSEFTGYTPPPTATGLHF